MRRSRLPLPRLYAIVQAYYKDTPSAGSAQRGRPRRYSDALILTLWLYQTLWQTSYRETLEMARWAGLPTPSLSTYHYRVARLPLSLFRRLLRDLAQVLVQHHAAPWRLFLVDGTGFGFRDAYRLRWRRGERLRLVHSHVRMVLLALVDAQGWGILWDAAVGPPYASETRLFQEILRAWEALPALPVVGDRGYDALAILKRLQAFHTTPALRMRTRWRQTLRHPLRKASQGHGRRWGKARYRVEGFFGAMKSKVGAAFPRVRQDLALRRALAVAVLYNLDRLVAFFMGCGSPRPQPFRMPCLGFFEHSHSLPLTAKVLFSIM